MQRLHEETVATPLQGDKIDLADVEERDMSSDRIYPLSLVAVLAMCAAIATAFVGSSRETNDAPVPVQSAVSTVQP